MMLASEGRKQFFFEKKNQKTFDFWRCSMFDFVDSERAVTQFHDMTVPKQAGLDEDTPGLIHRLVDRAIFPASVAAICTAVAGPLFGLLELAIGGRTGNTENLQAVVALLSATIAAVVTKRRP